MHHKDVPCDCKSSPTNYPDMLAINLFLIYIILSFLRMFISGIIQYVTFWDWHFSPNTHPGDQSTFSCVSVVHLFYCGVVFCTTLLHSLAIHSLKDVCLVPVWGYYNKMLCHSPHRCLPPPPSYSYLNAFIL